MLSPVTRKLIPYGLIVFLGYIGYSLPLPVLPEMFLDPKRSILPAAFSIEKKTILLGLIMAAYPLGQLLGAPILGRSSDKWGRKRVILISLIGTILGYAFTAFAASQNWVWGVFAGLWACGFSEGNVAIAQAVISDITEKEHRTQHFGFINLFVCTAFIVGPLIGGWLATEFTFAASFWFAALIAFGSLITVGWRAEETRKEGRKFPRFWSSFSLCWKNLELRKYYIANFFLYLGIFSYFRFLFVYLERRFDFSATQLGLVMAYDSVFFALALLWLIKRFSKFTPQKITAYSALFFGITLVIVVIPSSPYSLFWTIPWVGVALALVMTNAAVMVSQAAEAELQGQAMGSLQSIQVTAEVLTAAVGGFLAGTIPQLPLWIGAVMAWICTLILTRRKSHV